MATINFRLNKHISEKELYAILNSTVKRTRSGSLKRVYDEELAIEKYSDGRITRGGGSSFDSAYEKMDKEEQELYQVWQIEVSEETPKAEKESLDAAITALNNHPNVKYAELNHVYSLEWTPNELPGELYGLVKMECEKAWEFSRGQGVKIAVIDSGLNTKHIDITNNIALDAKGKFIARNFAEKNKKDVQDKYGHGTHVAGIIAALGNNAQGAVGVAPEAKIIPIKAFIGQKGDSSSLANSIKFAADCGAQVINNSWSYDESVPKDQTLEDAIEYALQKGAICVFAAGNYNEKLSNKYWIATHPNLIVVGATNQKDQKAPGSNWGPLITIAAPGFQISSLDAASNTAVLVKSGTSMATAYVSGAIALYLALHGPTTAQAIKAKLMASVDPIEGTPLGPGRLNCLKLLN